MTKRRTLQPKVSSRQTDGRDAEKRRKADLTADARRAFAQHLNQALDEYGVPRPNRAAWLAREFAVSPQAARKWLIGLSVPEAHRLGQISARLKVRQEYLSTGHGPMYFYEHGTWPFAFGRERFERLDDEQRAALERVLLEGIKAFERGRKRRE